MKLIGLLWLVTAITGCEKNRQENTSAKDSSFSPVKVAAPAPPVTPEAVIIPRPEIHFSLLTINDSTFKILTKNYTRQELTTILALNRINMERLQPNDSLVIPDTFLTGFNLYSPFPDSLPGASEIRKLLVFSYSIQAFAAYECGLLLRWGPVSMGKQSTPTPTGLLHTNWRARTTISTDDSTWILNWYYNLHNERGVSLHQYELPGYPASHACIRMFEEDAQWIYNWADGWKLNAERSRMRAYGTPVIIFGEYNFGASPPWLKLVEDSHANDIHPDTLAKELNPWLPLILERQKQRDSVVGINPTTVVY